MEKWYNELLFDGKTLKSKDGLASLLDLFTSEDDFIKHFIENTVFFKKEHIERQQLEFFDNYLANKKHLYARFSTKSNKHFYFKSENGRGFSVKKFKNRKEAHDFSRKNELYYRLDAENEILVHIDKDGNYEVRNQIAKFTDIRVSQGTLMSNYTNYMIGHIWGQTENPLYFTALWNIALIPTYLAFLLDKPDDNSNIVKKLKQIMKGLCYEFYDPKVISDKQLNEMKTEIEFAKKIQEAGYKITFI